LASLGRRYALQLAGLLGPSAFGLGLPLCGTAAQRWAGTTYFFSFGSYLRPEKK